MELIMRLLLRIFNIKLSMIYNYVFTNIEKRYGRHRPVNMINEMRISLVLFQKYTQNDDHG